MEGRSRRIVLRECVSRSSYSGGEKKNMCLNLVRSMKAKHPNVCISTYLLCSNHADWLTPEQVVDELWNEGAETYG